MEVGQMTGETVGVRHDPERRRFEIEGAAGTAVLTYDRAGQIVVFTHTLVPKALEGHGLGSRLARAGLDWARANGLKVVPQCPFVAAYIERHPEERELLA
jgi:predicted GNAT family acetyltransferase